MSQTHKIPITCKELDELINNFPQLAQKLENIEQQLANLLYNEIKITKFSNDVKTAENGSTVNKITFSWATSKTPTSIELAGETLDSNVTSYTLDNLGLTKDSDQAAKSWQLTVSDEREHKATATTSISFLDGVYYGTAEMPNNYDGSFVLSLQTKKLSSTPIKSFTVNATNITDYVYYCVPTHMGQCSFSVDGFEGGVSLVATVSVKNSYGHEQDYDIYCSDYAGIGTKTFEVATK